MTISDAADASQERIDFAPEYAGRRATSHGGGPVSVEAGFGSRATYVGRLSGRRLQVGDPPWVWLELEEITEQPEGSAEERIWCDEHTLFLHDADQHAAGPHDVG